VERTLSTQETHRMNHVVGFLESRVARPGRPGIARVLAMLALILPLAACSVTRTTNVASAPTPTVAATGAASAGSARTPTVIATTPTATDTPAATAQSTSTPTATPSVATPLPATPAGATPSASVAAAIQAVIQRGNQEQQQALAAHDPTLMKDTATPDYYNQLVQTLADLTNSGVAAIKLADLTWGPILLQGASSAQATTHETWQTTFIDGSTLQETDTNVYTLVLQNGTWLVGDDQHPNSRRLQPPSGTPSGTPTPVAPVPPVGPSQSRNWAGYAATGGTFTAVSATWTVPTVAPSTTPAADATWVGIGGVDTKDLIQAGTEGTVEGGQITYAAWLETLPQAQQTLPMDIAGGDTVNVTITQQADGSWQIVMKDTTRGQTYQTRVTYASSRSSAEWVEESPSAGRRLLLPLDNFGSVTFTGAGTVKDGQQRTIAQTNAQAITMASPTGQPLAQPSGLGADGASFTVTRTNVAAPSIAPGTTGDVPTRRPWE